MRSDTALCRQKKGAMGKVELNLTQQSLQHTHIHSYTHTHTNTHERKKLPNYNSFLVHEPGGTMLPEAKMDP